MLIGINGGYFPAICRVCFDSLSSKMGLTGDAGRAFVFLKPYGLVVPKYAVQRGYSEDGDINLWCEGQFVEFDPSHIPLALH